MSDHNNEGPGSTLAPSCSLTCWSKGIPGGLAVDESRLSALVPMVTAKMRGSASRLSGLAAPSRSYPGIRCCWRLLSGWRRKAHLWAARDSAGPWNALTELYSDAHRVEGGQWAVDSLFPACPSAAQNHNKLPR